MLRTLMGIEAADNEAARQRMIANQLYAEAQNRAGLEAAIRNANARAGEMKREGAVIIEGTFTVVDEPKLLEGK